MTSFRQIEANRRNACKSTGPITEEGKQRSRCNAVRHGLTAETVIGALEDAEDYKAFEAAIIADYDVQSAVEQELVLRLTSLMWRLRWATTMETGLFEIQTDYLREFRQGRLTQPEAQEIICARFGQSDSLDADPDRGSHGITNETEARPGSGPNPLIPPSTSHVAFCVWPICQATRSTGLADMKQSFGARPAKSCLLSMHWIVANHTKDGAVSASAASQNCRPTSAMSVDFRTRRLLRCSARRATDRNSQEIGFVSPGRPSQIVRRLSAMLLPMNGVNLWGASPAIRSSG